MSIAFVVTRGAFALPRFIVILASSQSKLLTDITADFLTFYVENVDHRNVSINILRRAVTDFSHLRTFEETSNPAQVSIGEKSKLSSFKIATAIAAIYTSKPNFHPSIQDI